MYTIPKTRGGGDRIEVSDQTSVILNKYIVIKIKVDLNWTNFTNGDYKWLESLNYKGIMYKHSITQRSELIKW